MRKKEYLRRVQLRINRSEAEMNATILRAMDRHMRVLERERTEVLIRADRAKKRVRT
jgi:hypothetical protein